MSKIHYVRIWHSDPTLPRYKLGCPRVNVACGLYIMKGNHTLTTDRKRADCLHCRAVLNTSWREALG
jgi:hypothetical protein